MDGTPASRAGNSPKTSPSRLVRRLGPEHLLEPLESRLLLSGDPLVEFAGATAAVGEGSAFTLNLQAPDDGQATVDHWTIHWGDLPDGQDVQTVAGNPSSVTHTYADGPNAFSITATATYSDEREISAHAMVLDSSFGSGGKVCVDLGWGNEYLTAVAVQSDGKIVAAGYASNNFVVARYSTGGSLDGTFGSGGKVSTDIGTNTVDAAYGLLILPDGRILVVGSSANDFALACYNTDGTLYTGFDTDGKATTNMGGTDCAYSVALQPDTGNGAKIVVAGKNTSDFAIARYNLDGSLDTSFGGTGKVTTDIGTSTTDAAYSILILPDGRILVAGSSANDFALACYNTDGTLYTGFDTDGKVTTNMGGTDCAHSVALLPDMGSGIKIVAAGAKSGDFALARYSLDGTLDTSFGSGGKAFADFGSASDTAKSIVIGSDGKIVAAGYTGASGAYNFALARFQAGGALDPVFGNGGKTTLDFGGNDSGACAALKSDGTLLVGGSGDSGDGNVNFSLAQCTAGTAVAVTVNNVVPLLQITGSGSPVNEGTPYEVALSRQSDPGDDTLSQWLIYWGDSDTPQAVDVTDNDPIEVTHTYTQALQVHNISAKAVDEDGTYGAANMLSLDGTFGSQGLVTTSIGGSAVVNGAVRQADGKLVVVGGYGASFLIARYNADGTIDEGFRTDGQTSHYGWFTTYVGSSGSGCAYGLAVQSDGKIVVVGTAQGPTAGRFAVVTYNADGTLDTTFNGTGKVITQVSQNDIAYAVAIQSNGKIVVVGTATSNGGNTQAFAIARYNTSGSLDSSFHGTGIVTGPGGSGLYAARSVVIQPDGKILEAGTVNGQFTTLRFTSSGAADASFNGSGTVTTSGTGSCYGMVLQSDGKIVLAGGNGNFVLARYNSNGTLDSTFDSDGKLLTNLSGTAYAVTLLPDGRIVAAGASGGNFAAACYTTTGGPDLTFCADGRLTVDVGGTDSATGMAITPDGKIVLAGTSGSNIALTRLGYLTVSDVTPGDVTIDGLVSCDEGDVDVTFDGSAQNPGDEPLTYEWSVTRDGQAFDLGPGVITDQSSFSFTPTDDGCYVIHLAISDDDGNTSYGTHDLTVGEVAPTLTATGDVTVSEGGSYRLILSWGDVTTEDSVVSWSIDWGDGTTPDNISGTADHADHIFADGYDRCTIVATATDDEENTYDATAVNVDVTPRAPGEPSATATASGQIDLAWVGSSIETGYRIERKTGAGGTYATLATVGVDVCTFSNTGLAAQTQYFYRVRALGAYGDSAWCTEVSATTPAAGMPFIDNFNRPDGTDIGGAWIEQQGNFEISDNQATSPYRNLLYDYPSLATLNGVTAGDVSVSVNYEIQSAAAGVLARYDSTTSYCVGEIHWDGSRYYASIFIQTGASSSTTVAYRDLGSDSKYAQGTLRLEAIGQSYGLYREDESGAELLTSGEDSGAHLSGGQVGLYADRHGDMYFNDFSVQARTFTPQDTSLPFSDNFDRIDSPALGEYWTERQGDFVVNGNKAISPYRLPPAGPSLATLNGVTAGDVSVSVKYQIQSFAAGVLVRYNSTASYCVGEIYWDGSHYYASIVIQTGVSSYTTVCSRDLGSNSKYAQGTLRLEAVGQSYGLYREDESGAELLTSGQDGGALVSSGQVGLYADRHGDMSFNDFSAEARTYTPHDATLPSSDDFDRIDSPALGEYWTERQGDFAVSGNKAISPYRLPPAGPSLATLNGVTAGDVSVSAKYQIQSFAAGLLARYNSTTSYCVGEIYWDGSHYYAGIFIQTGESSSTTVAYRDLGSNGKYSHGTLRLEAVGQSYGLYREDENGGELLTGGQDGEAHLSGGQVGIYADRHGDMCFNDFSAEVRSWCPQDASLPLEDAFDRSDSLILGDQWTETQGDLAISGHRVQSLVDGPATATVNGVSAADMLLSAEIDVADLSVGSSAGLDARMIASGRYRGQVRRVSGGLNAEILLEQNGDWTTLSSLDMGQGASDTGNLRFIVSGSSLVLYFDGRPAVQVTDNTITASGGAGLSIQNTNVAMDNFVAKAAPAPSSQEDASLPFQDDFDRPDGEDLGPTWATVQGGFAIGGDRALSLMGNESVATLRGISQANVSLSADIVIEPTAHSGVAGLEACSTANGAYRGQIRRDSYKFEYYAEVCRYNGSTWTALDSRPVSLAAACQTGTCQGRLRLEVLDGSLALYLDDALVAWAVDGSPLASGQMGLYACGACTFDNVDASVLTGPDEQEVTLPFADEMNRPDGLGLGAQWNQSGQMALRGGKAIAMAGGESVSTLQGLSVADIVLSATVGVPSNQAAGLVARYDSGTYYLACIGRTSGQAQILKVVGGAPTVLAGAALIATSGTLRFELAGQLLQLFLDDQLVASTTDGSITAAGDAGIYLKRYGTAADATLDDVTAAGPLSTPNAWLTLATQSDPRPQCWQAPAALDAVQRGDFDGDGRQDVAGLDLATGHWLVGISQGVTGFVTQTWATWASPADYTNIHVGDFNGDRRDDLAGYDPSNGNLVVAISTGTSFTTQTWGNWSSSTTWVDIRVGDFSGDQRDDLAGRDGATGDWRVAVSTGMEFASQAWGNWSPSVSWTDVLSGDFDGDGRGDLVGRDPATGQWTVVRSQGTHFQNETWGVWNPATAWADLCTGDFNGDLKADLIGRASGSDQWTVSLSTGTAFTSPATWTSASNLVDVHVGDFNGDGKDDLVGRTSGTRDWRAELSQANGLSDQYWTTFSSALDTSGALVGNFYDLPHRAAEALEWVYNNVRYEPYSGAMKGPDATEQTKEGNDWDQDALLVRSLRELGLQARFVSGRVTATSQEVLAWLGVRDSAAAEGVLDAAGLNAVLSGSGASETITFDHAWVEAHLAGSGGLTWRALDPSFKAKACQAGIDDISTLVPFDRDGYLRQDPSGEAYEELAYQYYEDQVAQYLHANHPGLSLADVPYDGPITAKSFQAVPDALPYTIAGGTTAYSDVPDIMKHRVKLTLFEMAFVPLTTGITLIALSVPDIALDTLQVTYTPSPYGDGYIPELRLGGKVIARGDDESLYGATMRLEIDHYAPGQIYPDEDLTTNYDRPCGEELAIGLDAGQYCDTPVAELQARVNQESLDYYASGCTDALLAASVFRDGMSLAVITYFARTRQQNQGIAGLYHLLPMHARVGDGVVTAPAELTFDWDRNIPIFSAKTNVDIKDQGDSFCVTDSGGDSMQSLLAGCRLGGLNSSAWESVTLEQLLGAQAISTVKGLQYAAGTGNTVFDIDTSNADTYLPQIPSYIRTTVAGYVNDGCTVTIPRDNLSFALWDGTVFIVEKVTQTDYMSGYVIVQTGPTYGAALIDLCLLNLYFKLNGLTPIFGDPVNVATGTFQRHETDIRIANTALPLELERFYDSGQTQDVGFGVGWRHTYSDFLSFGTDQSVTWSDANGVDYTFALVAGAYVTPDGIFGRLTHESGGDYVYSNTHGACRRFNAAGLLTEISDANSNALIVARDEAGRITSVYDSQATSRRLDFAYTGDQITGVTDFTGRAWTYQYVSMIDPQTMTTLYHLSRADTPSDEATLPVDMTYTYYSEGRLQGLMHTVASADGAGVIQCEYYANRRVFRVIDPQGGAEVFEYNLLRSSTRYVDSLGNATETRLDSIGAATRIIYPDRTRESFTWTDQLLASHTDTLGRVETFQYDPNGNLTAYVATDGLQALYEYDQTFNKITSVTLPGGRVTQYGYDSSGNLTSVQDALGALTTMTHDTRGRITAVTLPKGNVAEPDGNYTATYTYNDAGLVLTESTALGTLTHTYDARGNLLSTDDGTGRVTAWHYDLLDQCVRVEEPDPDGAAPFDPIATVYAYADGNLVSVTDARGYTTRFVYDFSQRLVRTISPDGTFNNLAYDPAGNLLCSTDELGRTTKYFYDSRNRLVQTVYPDGSSERQAYDSGGRMVAVTDALGFTTTFAYDSGDRILEARDPLEQVTTFAYNDVGQLAAETGQHGTTTYARDLLGRVTQVRGPEGYVTTTDYDPDGNVSCQGRYDVTGLESIPEDPRELSVGRHRDVRWAYDELDRPVTRTDPAGNASHVTYDTAGRVLTTTDELGRTTTYAYDAAGRLIELTDPDPDGEGPLTSPTTSFALDAAGNTVGVTDPLGHATAFAYDFLGRQMATTDARGDTSGVAYDPAGQVVSILDELGQSMLFTYDLCGRIVRQELPDPDGAGPQQSPVLLSEYDACGNPIRTADASGVVTQFEYDALGRVITRTGPDPDGSGPLASPVTACAYDHDDLVAVTDALGQTTSYAYDEAGRQVRQTLPDPDGEGPLDAPQTTYAYDSLGELLSVTDPDQNTTSYEYDLLGRVVTETNELAAARNYTYDAAGNTLSITDRNGRTRQFVYDDLDRCIEERWMDGQTSVRTITYEYDANGQLTGVSDPDSSYAYSYDELGRMVSVDNDGTPGVPQAAISQQYDAAGRRTSLAATVDDTADFLNFYQYDALGRLTRVTQTSVAGGAAVADKRVDFKYAPDDRYSAIRRYADLDGQEEAAATSFNYDATGRLTVLTHTHDTTTLAAYGWTYDAAGRITGFSTPDDSAAYTYDADGQLTGADYTSQADEAYAYDPNGNRTGEDFETSDDNRLAADGSFAYQYDDEGNLIRKTDQATGESVEYAWDYRGRLTDLTFRDSEGAVTQRVRYTYDVHNRRIGKEVDADADDIYEQVQRYVYDGDDIVLVFDDSGVLLHRFLQGPETDQVLADEDASGDVTWMLADHEGSVRDVVTSDGTSVNHIVYDSYGNVFSQTPGAPSLRYGFAGRELDAESGLYYNRLRYYDPATGRFLSQDPIAFGAGDSNLYRYVGNSPVNFTDPSGLKYVDPLVTAKPADLLTLKKTAIRELGLLQAAQGGVESYAGIAAIRTGYGAPVGVLALGHGLDQGYAGIRQAITGERCVTQFERGLKAMGVPAWFAPAANAMLGAALTGACSVHVLMPRISGQIGQGEGALGSVRPANNAAPMLRNLSTSDFGEDAVFLHGRAAPGPSAIVKALDQGNIFSRAVAQAIRDGDIKVIYAPMKGSEAQYAMGTMEPIELNNRRLDLFTGPEAPWRAAANVVHEAQHIVDDSHDIVKANLYFEAKAFLRQEQYAKAVGKPDLSKFQQVAEAQHTDRWGAWEWLKNEYRKQYGLGRSTP